MQIPPEILSVAAELFQLSEPLIFFARSHLHSRGHLYESDNYLLKIVCGSSPQEYQVITEQMRYAMWLRTLGLQTQCFLYSTQNKLLELINRPSDCYLVSAWHKIKGKPLPDLHPRDLRAFYTAWAELLAETHRVSHLYKSKQPLHWHSEWQACHNSLRDLEVQRCHDELKAELDLRDISRANFGQIHNDAHPQNIVQNEQGLHLIDFERSCEHFFVMDITNAIYSEYSRIGFHSVHKAAYAQLKELFLMPFIEAYAKSYRLPEEDLRDIETFLYYRQILMFSIFYEELKATAPKYLKEFRKNILAHKNFLDTDLLSLLS